MQNTPQDLHISHERNKSGNIPILVEERWDAFRGIPKLRRLSPWIFTWGALGIPKLELLPLLLLLTSRPPQSSNTSSTQNSTESSVRSVSIIKQITTLSTVSNQFIFCFMHCIYCNITFPWLHTLIEIDSFIKTSKLCIKNRICLKQDSL